jgi:hypothetical protein
MYYILGCEEMAEDSVRNENSILFNAIGGGADF